MIDRRILKYLAQMETHAKKNRGYITVKCQKFISLSNLVYIFSSTLINSCLNTDLVLISYTRNLRILHNINLIKNLLVYCHTQIQI